MKCRRQVDTNSLMMLVLVKDDHIIKHVFTGTEQFLDMI
jgi:hypothetical protein